MRPSKNTVARRGQASSLRSDQEKTLCHKKEQSLLSERPSKNLVSQGTKLTIWGERKQKIPFHKKVQSLLYDTSLKSANSLIRSPTVSQLKQSIIYSTDSGCETKQTHCHKKGPSLLSEENQAKTLCHKKKQNFLSEERPRKVIVSQEGTKLTIWGETKQKHCYKGQSLLSEERPSKNTVTRDKAYYLRRDQAKTLLQGTKLTIWGETKQKHCYKGQSLLSEERPSKKHCVTRRNKAYYLRRDQAKTLLQGTKLTIRGETKQKHCVTKRGHVCWITYH